MAESKEIGERKQPDGMVIQIVVSLAVVIIGALLLSVPKIEIKALCYIFCFIVIISGVISVIQFFLGEAYKRFYDYHFAEGVLLIILGICGILRVAGLVEYIEMYMGGLSLILGTVILQGAVSLKLIDSILWIPETIFSVVILLGITPILMGIEGIMSKIERYTYWVFMASGVLSLLSILISWFGVSRYRKQSVTWEETTDQEEDAEETEDSIQ